MYTVRRLNEARTTYTTDTQIDAASHRDAAALSLLAEPGARLIVSDGRTVVRYHVDRRGRIVEQSRYSGEVSR